MSILTNFFVASESKLEEISDGWLPVAPKKYREVVNPLTGNIQLDRGTEPEALANLPTNQSVRTNYAKEEKVGAFQQLLPRRAKSTGSSGNRFLDAITCQSQSHRCGEALRASHNSHTAIIRGVFERGLLKSRAGK